MQFSTGLAIHTAARVVVPTKIREKLLGILSHIPTPGLEYGVYLQGVWDPKTATVTIDPDKMYFPRQVVTNASITFDEEPPSPEWNVVAHRHPPGCRTFSATDKNSINEEFLASILFIPPRDFPDAVINIPLALGSKMQVRAQVITEEEEIKLSDSFIKTIKENISVYQVKPKILNQRPDCPVQEKLSGLMVKQVSIEDSYFQELHDRVSLENPYMSSEDIDDMVESMLEAQNQLGQF